MIRAVADTIGPHKMELIAEMEHTCGAQDCTAWSRRRETTFRACFLPLLRRTARSSLHRLLKRVTMREIAASSKDKPTRSMFSSVPACRRPRRPCRIVAAPDGCCCLLPRDLSSAELVQRIRDEVPTPPTVLADKENEVLLCYEMEQLPLPRVAAAVLDQRFQNVEVASRLHTRIDVQWSNL